MNVLTESEKKELLAETINDCFSVHAAKRNNWKNKVLKHVKISCAQCGTLTEIPTYGVLAVEKDLKCSGCGQIVVRIFSYEVTKEIA